MSVSEPPAGSSGPAGSAGSLDGTHSAASSVLGYEFQTQWGLLELLRHRIERPDMSLTLEMADDIAWDAAGTPAELKQLKFHGKVTGHLGDSGDDLWRTIGVWLDNGRPADPYGPTLILVTNAVASAGSAASLLRPGSDRDPAAAMARLETAATNSTAATSTRIRDRFLKLDASDRAAFVARIYVTDASPGFEKIEDEVRGLLWGGAPTDPSKQADYLDLVWQWWRRTALALLRGHASAVTVTELALALERIRDSFSADSLPTFVELADVDEQQVMLDHGDRTFVKQLQWVGVPSVHLNKAVVDYFRAFTQRTRWLDRNFLDAIELDGFVDRVKDEWDREFAWMVDELGNPASEEDMQLAGKALFRKLTASTLTIRQRYTDPFFTRGTQHSLADQGTHGWHPSFESRLAQLLGVAESEAS